MAYDRINVRAVISDDNKLFVVKHKKERDYYALPGGGMDAGEGAKDSLRREILEELGVECTVGDLLYVNEFYAKGRDINVLEMFFEVTAHTLLTTNIHHGTSHAHEIYESKRVELGTDTILPPWIGPTMFDQGFKCFHSEPLKTR